MTWQLAEYGPYDRWAIIVDFL